jgi:alpha-L-arabinofuranosidase
MLETRLRRVCEALGATCVLGFAVHCGDQHGGVEDLADFIDYALAPSNGSNAWGMLRAADGHALPYKLTHVQLGNEQLVPELVGTFAPKAAAMEARAKALGLGGTLTYVLGSDMRSDSGASVVADGNTTLVLREIKAVGLCQQTVWDWHISAPTDGSQQRCSVRPL